MRPAPRDRAPAHARDVCASCARSRAGTCCAALVLHRAQLLAVELLRRARRCATCARRSPIRASLFTSFIAYAFGHNLGFAAFTGAADALSAVCHRGPHGDRCRHRAGLLQPHHRHRACDARRAVAAARARAQRAPVLHLHPRWAMLVGDRAAVRASSPTRLWCILGATAARDPRLGAARPAPADRLRRRSRCRLLRSELSAAVLWWLLPPRADMGFLTFLGAYAAAVTAGIISHVPGGIGVFETVIVLRAAGRARRTRCSARCSPIAPSTTSCRCCSATLLFGAKELAAQRGPLARAHELASLYIAPVVPQVAGTLTFLAGFMLLVSGATPGDRCAPRSAAPIPAARHPRALAPGGQRHRPRALVLARALFRRVQAAYHISFWLLVAGIVASLLKGLDFEEAMVLAHRARGAGARAARVLPADVDSRRALHADLGGQHRRRDRHGDLGRRSSRTATSSTRNDLWWTFAMDAQRAAHAARHVLVVVVLAAAYLLLNLLRPARPEPGGRRVPEDLERARAHHRAARSHDGQCRAERRQAPAVQRRRRCLRHVSGRRPQLDRARRSGRRRRRAPRSWCGAFASCPTITAAARCSIRRAPTPAAVHRSGACGAEDRRGGARAARRISRSRARRAPTCARRGGARSATARASRSSRPSASTRSCRSCGASRTRGWRASPSREKRFSVGAFSRRVHAQLPDRARALAKAAPRRLPICGPPDSKEELSVDLMRFGPDAPRGAMDYMFIELMLWGRAQGYRWFNLGMAPLAGLERHPLAPAWHRVGNFVFRHGEHFYNFDGLRRYKAKFDPVVGAEVSGRARRHRAAAHAGRRVGADRRAA